MADITQINVNGTTYSIKDSSAMALVSSPTNGNLLITDSSGQAVDSGVEPGIQMDLLWTNSSLSSSFGAQTITISDYSGYKFLIFELHYFTSTSGHDLKTDIVPVQIGDNFWLGGTRATSSDTIQRMVTLTSATQITFDQGRAGTNISNSFAIPYIIYGVK